MTTPLNLDHMRARLFGRPRTQCVDIVLVGCGGTGSWLARSLVQTAKAETDAQVTLTFIDFDRVEAKNLQRQNFCDAEVGKNKARLLAQRYGLAWGLPIGYIDARFEPGMLSSLRNSQTRHGRHGPGGYGDDTAYHHMHTLLVGCVDNAAARQAIRKALIQSNGTTTWLDCGNFESSGQVTIGTVSNVSALAGAFDIKGLCSRLPDAFMLFPNLSAPQPEELPADGSGLSCQDITARNVQAAMINQQVAVIAGQYVNLWLSGLLRTFLTTFTLDLLAMRSRYITPEAVAGALAPNELGVPYGTNVFRVQRERNGR